MYCLAFPCCVAYVLYIHATLSFSPCHHVCCSSVCSLVDFHLIDFLTCHLALCPMCRACADPARSLRLHCLVLSCWLYFFRSVVCRWCIGLGIQISCPVDPRYWGNQSLRFLSPENSAHAAPGNEYYIVFAPARSLRVVYATQVNPFVGRGGP
jgi:hypothetical protein